MDEFTHYYAVDLAYLLGVLDAATKTAVGQLDVLTTVSDAVFTGLDSEAMRQVVKTYQDGLDDAWLGDKQIADLIADRRFALADTKPRYREREDYWQPLREKAEEIRQTPVATTRVDY